MNDRDDGLAYWIATCVVAGLFVVLFAKWCHQVKTCNDRGGRYVRSNEPGRMGECVKPLPDHP